jgi:serine/threonine protein kinase
MMNDDEVKASLLEAQIMQKLDHPNIISFKDTFIMKKPKKSLCIVMDYADGKFHLTKAVI